MNRGDVIYFPDFVFLDGGHANKRLIILTDPSISDKIFCILTTSQERHNRKKDVGCQPAKKEFFIRAGNEFEKDTWLLLGRQPVMLPVTVLENKIALGACSIIKTLSEQRVNEIRNCLGRDTSHLTKAHCQLLGVKYQQ